MFQASQVVLEVKNLAANAGDTGSTLGPRRCDMLQSGWAHAPQLLSLGAVSTEARVPQTLLSAAKENAAMRSACAATREWPRLIATRENPAW